MESPERNLPFRFDPGRLRPDGTVDPSTTKNVKWVARLGSQTYGDPTVSNGRVFVGTNNEGRRDPRFKGDYSLLQCLDATDGRELWTLTVPKLGTGKVGDWEYLGICSSPTVVGDRVYIVTNRCEVMCLDVNGLADGNQGDQDEAEYMSYVGSRPGRPVELKATDADIIWRFNMIEELGVFPHNVTAGAPLVIGDIVYCNTSNGVTYDHSGIPAPKAPVLIALNRRLAELPGTKPAQILVGEEGSGISRRLYHCAWTGPSWGEIGGRGTLLYGGPDGYCYAFDPTPVKDADGLGLFRELWRYDCNPIDLRYQGGDTTRPNKYAVQGKGGPSEVFGAPVFYKGRVYVSIGQDPEHRGGPGNLSCIEADTGRQAWDLRMNRSLSTCSIVNDRIYLADFSGLLHCIDANTGTRTWSYDSLAEVWGSTLVADGKVYMGNKDGILSIFSTERMRRLADELGPGLEVESDGQILFLLRNGRVLRAILGNEAGKIFQEVRFPSEIHCPPIAARGVLYVATMRHLYAITTDGE